MEAVVVGIASQLAFPAGAWWAALAFTPVSLPVLLMFAVAATAVALRFIYVQRSMESGWFWSMVPALVALHYGATTLRGRAMFATAAGAIAIAVIESSYFMAFHDELTGLPSRRAFNQALRSLGEVFAIAVVDVDHFKRFNDTFGHETGDQVLRLVASRLGNAGGRGRAFRTGGEEFALVFRGATLANALPYLEELRLEISETIFTVRSPDRPRHTPDDRRSTRTRGTRDIAITVSMGVAQAGAKLHSAEQVLRAADQALYRAKENGRNRVEVFTGTRRAPAQAPATNARPVAPVS